MKKKLLTLGLSSTLALGSIMPAFANSISDNTDKTYIETAIGFKYPETVESLRNKNLKATLRGNASLELELNRFLDGDTSSIDIDGYTITSEITKENNKVTVIKFKIENLKASDGYNLTLEGKNYVTTSVDLSTSNYSKRVNISTETNMVLGDVNKDNKVDLEDRKLLEENLNKNDSQLDLNNDGKITVSDIAIVNANMVEVTEPEVFETEKVASKIIENVNQDEITNSVDIKEGDKIENLFVKGETVSFKAKQGEDKVSIPVNFETPEELSVVEVVIPQGAENTVVTVLDENDNVLGKVDSLDLVTYSRTGEKVINVNLGARKPVKKIIVDVVPTEEGGYVVVDEIKLIWDIVNEDIVQDTTVKNVKAVAGDEKVSLSWREVPNVTGYKVYYGTDANNLDKIATSQDTSITISGLENLTTYYFAVSATSGTWEGNKSSIVSAMPEPAKLPNRPDFVTAVGRDSSITVSWQKAENAKTYNIYAKTDKDDDYTKVAYDIKGTSYTIPNLTNNTTYTLYVTSQNDVGESRPSELVDATPKKQEIIPPTLPSKNRIDSSNITKVVLSGNGQDYDKKLYPDGFNADWLIDNDFNTHWVAEDWGSWGQENSFTFTFDEPKTMDYLIWVPRLDGAYKNGEYIENAYRRSFTAYNITVWTEDDDLTKPGKQIVENKSITLKNKDDSYFVFDFPKQENVKQIKVKPIQWAGSFTHMNGSEAVFYEYNNIADRIDALFANQSKTELKEGITEEEINALKAEITDLDGFVIDRDILLKELDIATSLAKGNTENLGVIKDNIYSIKPANDVSKYGKSINNWQPLGVVGLANKKVAIYADIPEGETVELVPTQFFEEASKLSAQPIKLKSGRNIITIPKIGSINTDRGGSLYVTYSGDNPSDVKLQIVGANKIPYLELRDFYTIGEEAAKKRIETYIDELIAYDPYSLPGNKEIQNLNQTEISLPNVLLSLPATKVLDGINQNTSSKEEKINKLYDTMLAWEQVMQVTYKTYGIDSEETNILETRHNIRYMKMFANAFMYASGNHIGIGYNSVAPLMNGKPVNESTTTENNLFGWGIAHEIGHVMDTFGKAEVTNNIYSLMLQTYDGQANILPSRLEESGVYEKAFNKVAVGSEGVPNDLFVHLAMYWQLHLAYDDAQNPFNFYNQLHKLYRTDSSLNSFSDMDKFAVASSKVAQKDLTEFFTRWGVSLSEEAKNQMKTQSKEDRAIYYLNDSSRRKRIENNPGNTNIETNVTLNVEKAENSKNDKAKEVVINITSQSENVQGYEILRKGGGDSEFKPIGFTTTGIYKDYIGSANNMSFTYAIKPVDVLGNVNAQKEVGQVRISYDNTIDKGLYKLDEASGTVTFNEPTIVTGIKVTPKNEGTVMPTGKYQVYADIVADVAPASTENMVLAKDGDFNEGNFATTPNTYISYFGKEGSTEDKIFAYDVNSLKLTGFDFNNYNVEFISYPGDNVEFLEMGVGRLASDYTYDSVDDNGAPIKETIPADTLVIIGKYRGNSAISNIYIKGKYATENSLNETIETEERLVAGYSLMFDTLDADGTITSSTAEGIFMFVPNIQEDNQGDHPEKLSILPTEIMAEMWQGPYGETSSRLTSDTMWINMPSDESLPKIVITSDSENTPKITIK